MCIIPLNVENFFRTKRKQEENELKDSQYSTKKETNVEKADCLLFSNSRCHSESMQTKNLNANNAADIHCQDAVFDLEILRYAHDDRGEKTNY